MFTSPNTPEGVDGEGPAILGLTRRGRTRLPTVLGDSPEGVKPGDSPEGVKPDSDPFGSGAIPATPPTSLSEVRSGHCTHSGLHLVGVDFVLEGEVKLRFSSGPLTIVPGAWGTCSSPTTERQPPGPRGRHGHVFDGGVGPGTCGHAAGPEGGRRERNKTQKGLKRMAAGRYGEGKTPPTHTGPTSFRTDFLVALFLTACGNFRA